MSFNSNPKYQMVHIFPDGKEKIVDRFFVSYTAGELFPELFNEYTYVYLEHVVWYGPLVHRLQRETRLQDAMDALGAHGDVVTIYADNRAV
jgi:hypothetical protein